MENTYQEYVAACRRDWVATLSFAEWSRYGQPKDSDDWVRLCNERSGYVPPTHKQIILDDGYTATVKVEPKREVKSSGLLRLPDMFRKGKIKAGDVLTVVKHEDARATVIDGNRVMFDNGDKQIPMTYNEFGQRIVGHKALNVYIWIKANGTLLNDLRS